MLHDFVFYTLVVCSYLLEMIYYTIFLETTPRMFNSMLLFDLGIVAYKYYLLNLVFFPIDFQ